MIFIHLIIMNPKSDKMQEKTSDPKDDPPSFKPNTSDSGLVPSGQQYIPGVVVTDLKSNKAILKTSNKDAEKIDPGLKNPSLSSSGFEESHEKSERPSLDSSKYLSKDFERPYHKTLEINENPELSTDIKVRESEIKNIKIAGQERYAFDSSGRTGKYSNNDSGSEENKHKEMREIHKRYSQSPNRNLADQQHNILKKTSETILQPPNIAPPPTAQSILPPEPKYSSKYPKSSQEYSKAPDKYTIDSSKPKPAQKSEIEIKTKPEVPRKQSQVLGTKEKLSTKEKPYKIEKKYDSDSSNIPGESAYELTEENKEKFRDDKNIVIRTEKDEKGIEITSRKATLKEIQLYSGQEKFKKSSGPGYYEEEINYREGGQTFRIGQHERGYIEKHQNLAQGEYEVIGSGEKREWVHGSESKQKEVAGSHHLTETKYSVSYTTTGKGKEIINKVPATGEYSFKESRKYSKESEIGTASRPPLTETSDFPGPGAYNIEHQIEGPQITMQWRHSQKIKETPGPGHYDQELIIRERSPTYRIGSAERVDIEGNEIPGPGTYEIQEKERGTKWVIGSEPRSKEHFTETPGPGAYDYKEIKSSVAYTMSGKGKNLTKDDYPGPGTYELREDGTKPSPPKYRMAGTSRDKYH